MPLLRRTPALVATGVLALGAAVLVQTTATADDPQPPPFDYDATLTEASLPPTDPVELLTTPALSETLQQNFQQAVQQCVERTGFEYTAPAAAPAPGATALRPDGEEGYGVVVSHTAEVVDAAVAAEEEAYEVNLEYAESLPPAEEEVYLEVIGAEPPAEPIAAEEPQNCQMAAVEEVLEPAMQAQVALAEQTFAIAEAIEARPEVQAAEAEWSDCMQAAGHDYASPEEPEQEILSAITESSSPPDLEALLAEETSVAAADAGCRDETGFTAVVEAAAAAEWAAADIDSSTIEAAAGAVQ